MPELFRAALPAALEGLQALGRHDLRRVALKLERVIERVQDALASEPLTLCHGDFRPDNLMFRDTASGSRLTVVDWQIMSQSRGPSDIGYLMGCGVQPELRRAEEMTLLRRYHDRLTSLGVTNYDFDTCGEDYRRAVLWGLTYWVQGFSAADPGNDRTQRFLKGWAARLAAAIDDLLLEDLLQ